MKINKNTRVLLITLIAMLTIPVTLLWSTEDSDETTNSSESSIASQQAEPVLPKVSVTELKLGRYQGIIQGFGEVTSTDVLTLQSDVSGRVLWKNPAFIQGGQIDKGEVLIKLDQSAYQLKLANAKQELANAKLALQQEEANSKRAEQDWQHSGLTERPNALMLRKPQIEAAKLRYEAAIAQVTYSQLQLDKTAISAPFNAIVTQQTVTLGSYINSGSVIATLNASNQAQIRVALSEHEWHKLDQKLAGKRVTIHGSHGKSWQGKIQSLSLNIDVNTRTRELTILVDQPLQQSPPLLFGRFVGVDIHTRQQHQVFAIPASSVTADGHIWLAKDQRLQRYSLPPNILDGEVYVLPKGKLSSSIRIVTKPLSSYYDGMKALTTEGDL